MLAAAVFGGGLLDAVAGGGGLLTVPAFLAAGLPPVAALGTNKIVAVTGSFTSTLRFARAGLVSRSTLVLALLAVLGSSLGAASAMAVPDRVLKPVLIVLLLGALAAVLWQQRRGFTPGRVPTRPTAALWLGTAALGFYDGFFGPGTGTFFLALLAACAGMALEDAAGNAKLLNLGSNLGAVLVFAWRGSPWPLLAASLIPVMMAGSWVGASLAVRRGRGTIKAFLTASVLALCAKLAWDLWR